MTAGCGGCCCCGFLLLLGVVLLIWLVLGCVGGTVLCCLLFGLRFGGGLVLVVLDGCFTVGGVCVGTCCLRGFRIVDFCGFVCFGCWLVELFVC